MDEFFRKFPYSLEMLAALTKAEVVSPETVRLLLTAHLKEDAKEEYESLQTIITLSQMFTSPFDKPNASVSDPIGIFWRSLLVHL